MKIICLFSLLCLLSTGAKCKPVSGLEPSVFYPEGSIRFLQVFGVVDCEEFRWDLCFASYFESQKGVASFAEIKDVCLIALEKSSVFFGDSVLISYEEHPGDRIFFSVALNDRDEISVLFKFRDDILVKVLFAMDSKVGEAERVSP